MAGLADLAATLPVPRLSPLIALAAALDAIFTQLARGALEALLSLPPRMGGGVSVEILRWILYTRGPDKNARSWPKVG